MGRRGLQWILKTGYCRAYIDRVNKIWQNINKLQLKYVFTKWDLRWHLKVAVQSVDLRNLMAEFQDKFWSWLELLCLLVILRFGFIDFDEFRFDFSINNSISIRFGFDFYAICTPLLTELDSCVAAWEWQCCGAGHPRCPLSTVRTSPTLVNRPTCLRAYNTRGCR